MTDKGQFRPGQSGNPTGRPAGSRNRTSAALDAIVDEDAEAIVKALVEKAKTGDAVAAKPILDRIWPPRKSARITFDLPPIETTGQVLAALNAISRQVAEGHLSPEEGAVIVGLIDVQRRALETSDLLARLAALEERMGAK